MLIIKRSNVLNQRKKKFFLCNSLAVLPYSFDRKLYNSSVDRTYTFLSIQSYILIYYLF
jgi:hypothetical protein